MDRGRETHFKLSVARMIRHGHPHRYPYGYPCKWSETVDICTDIPSPVTIYLDFHTGIRANIRVKLSALRTQFDQGTHSLMEMRTS